MRTREEQIDSLYHDYIYTALSRSDFRAHILEAEIRAEQRVRAEIARDSERLDWLNKDFFENGGVLFTGRYENMGTPNWKAIGVAHEDYIELGYKPTIREAIDAARETEKCQHHSTKK